MVWLILFLSLIIMLVGSNQLIKGCVRLSKKFQISEFVISVIIIGIGTSLPELFVSFISGNREMGTLILSNNIASNIINILGILGIGAIIRPIILSSVKNSLDLIFMIIATIVLSIMVFIGTLGFIHGVILFMILAAYLFYVAHHHRYVVDNTYNGKIIAVPILVGIFALYFGSEAFMDAVQKISAMYNLNETATGIFIVGPATAMPELMVTIIAAIRGKSAIVIGNIVGSNLMNIALVIAVGAMITALPATNHIKYFDMPTMIIATLILFLTVKYRMAISRPMGAIYLTLLAAYLVVAWLV